MDTLTMEIAGMRCGHCARAVTDALAALDGVAVERVAAGSATVTYDPRAVSPDRITRAVEAAGYAARPAAA